MKRFLFIIATIFALSLFVNAQQQTPKQETPAVTAEQQQVFAQAVSEAQSAQKDAEAAQARLEAAQAKLQATILRVMAKLKLDPDEWRAVLTKEGQLTFEKVPTDKEGKQ